VRATAPYGDVAVRCSRRTRAEEITLFKSVDTALADLAAARLMAQWVEVQWVHVQWVQAQRVQVHR
jgi:ornithine cyclodeaminase/alanine dehydrogenase-like protein (mu-crystallin family)